MDTVEVSIARLETKMDGLIERLDRREADDKEARHSAGAAVADLEKRIATLERWRSALIGGSAAVGAAASTLVHILLSLIH